MLILCVSNMKKHYIYICKDYFHTAKNNCMLHCGHTTSFLYLRLQEDNGLPVHIKGGFTDVLLYRLTMTITIAGTKPFWSIMKT